MRFLLDANLAPALARQIRTLGYDCSHVFDTLSPDAADAAIARLANRSGAIVITKDIDYFDLKTRGILETPLVWLRTGNMSNRRTAQVLLPAMPRIAAAIESGDSIVEIL
jgi:predicted nuclease of predicted toxin-antitoxin system